MYVAAAVNDDGPALTRERRVLALTAAAAASLRTDYWFSHETAALLHGLAVYRLSEQVHVIQTWKPKVRRDRDPYLRRHPVTLPERDRTAIGALPVTTLERTLVDCARWLPEVRALVVADSAFRAGARRDVVHKILAEAAGRPGVRQARRVVELADERAESPGESIVRWYVLEAGLDPPELAVAVDTWRGTYWLDLAWRGPKVGIEFDGAVKYSGREYGDPQERLLDEKRRHDALVEAGWTILRVTWADLRDPDRLVMRVRRAIERSAMVRRDSAR